MNNLYSGGDTSTCSQSHLPSDKYLNLSACDNFSSQNFWQRCGCCCDLFLSQISIRAFQVMLLCVKTFWVRSAESFFLVPWNFQTSQNWKSQQQQKFKRVLWACSFIVLLLLLGYARTIGVCACLGLWMWLYFGETEDVTYLNSRLCCELCRGKVSFRRWLPIVCSCRRGPSAGGATPLVATKCHSWPGIFNNVCPILGWSAVFPLSFVEVGAWYS